MKDSKEKEHRISNLKDMINNITDEEPLVDELEEDSELINYLNEDKIDYDNLEINDEFIYHPKDDDSASVNLEENPIDEDFIIKTPKTEDIDENTDEYDEFADDLVGDISENFENVLHAKIRGRPILAILSPIVGVAFVIISIYIFQSRSDRVVDNVVAGESSFMFVIFLIVGLFLIIYGIYRLFDIKNPFEKITSSIDTIDNDKEDTDKKEEPSPKTIPKSEIPLDKDSYKIGEFDFDDVKNTLKKPANSKKNKPDEEDIENIPPAKEKTPEPEDVPGERIENEEYKQAKLKYESIDEIFAEVEDMEDLDIVSIDSKEEK